MIRTVTHPHLGEITLSQRPANRRISLSVKPSGEIRLNFPTGVAESRALAFLDSKTEWILRSRARLAASRPALHDYSDKEIEELRRKAKATLPDKVACFAARFGFKVGRVTIRAARTKWGCCTSQNNISLSLFLVALPEHLQDYVVIHELCHTVHHNHSEKFHALVNRCTEGRERQLQRELRHYRTI